MPVPFPTMPFLSFMTKFLMESYGFNKGVKHQDESVAKTPFNLTNNCEFLMRTPRERGGWVLGGTGGWS